MYFHQILLSMVNIHVHLYCEGYVIICGYLWGARKNHSVILFFYHPLKHRKLSVNISHEHGLIIHHVYVSFLTSNFFICIPLNFNKLLVYQFIFQWGYKLMEHFPSPPLLLIFPTLIYQWYCKYMYIYLVLQFRVIAKFGPRVLYL